MRKNLKYAKYVVFVVLIVAVNLVALTQFSLSYGAFSWQGIFGPAPYPLPPMNFYLPFVYNYHEACPTVPTLLSPADKSTLGTIVPEFVWDGHDNSNATQLRLQVARDPDFTEIVAVLWSDQTGFGYFRFPINFEPATTHYWRAKLICDETEGLYTETWTFTTGSGGTILPAPTLLAPENGAQINAPFVTLDWSYVSGAVEYASFWRDLSGSGFAFQWVSDSQVDIGLFSGTTYEWWAVARNDYALGVGSAAWEFSTMTGESGVSPQSPHGIFYTEDGETWFILEGQDSR